MSEMETALSAGEEMQDEMLTRALEQPPKSAVPADFAARVRSALPPIRPARRSMRWGKILPLSALGISALAMFALAPHATPSFSSLQFDLEMLLLAQMGAIGWWVGVRQGAGNRE